MSSTASPSSPTAILSRSKKIPWVGIPLFLWLLWFLAFPLTLVLVYSFLKRGTYGGIVWTPSLTNYWRALDSLYLWIFYDSFKLALLSTLSCLLIGYPMAYAMSVAAKKWRAVMMFLLIVPFMTNFVVRAYALKVLLGMDGPINRLLLTLGWISEPLTLTNTTWTVLLGMTINYLPFMVLPLYVSLEKFDFSLFEAARDLGANPFPIITKILLPLTRPGIITGSLLVFIPAFGEFVIPNLFGGARTVLMGNVITDQFLTVRDWTFGSTLSILLFVVIGLGLWIQKRFVPQEDRS